LQPRRALLREWFSARPPIPPSGSQTVRIGAVSASGIKICPAVTKFFPHLNDKSIIAAPKNSDFPSAKKSAPLSALNFLQNFPFGSFFDFSARRSKIALIFL